VIAGLNFNCALLTGGSVMCWGDDSLGQLGNGTSTTTPIQGPVDVTGLTGGVKAVSAGSDSACALTASGGVKCWGWNVYGQLGTGSLPQSATPVDVTGLTSGITAISAGDQHACAVTTQGGVKCWGSNKNGQLGDGTTTDSAVPVDVTGMSGVTAIASGADDDPVNHYGAFTCALTSAGGVKCWGGNSAGQLGNGATTDSPIPVDVAGLTAGVSQIFAGADYACALMSAGGVKCWGGASAVPTDVAGLTGGVTSIAVGDANTPVACAVTGAGGVKCWDKRAQTPGDYPGLTSDVSTIALYAGHVCVVRTSGVVSCQAGSNAPFVDVAGLIPGTGAGPTSQPTTAGGGGNIEAITAGFASTCVLTGSGGAKCWGLNQYGQLGNGSTASSSLVPVDVLGLTSDVSEVAAGNQYACALTDAGGIKCWGANDTGQLGTGTTTSSLIPVDVPGLTSGIKAISTGGAADTGEQGAGATTCALTSSGGVKCWGSGSLGDGAAQQGSLTPVDVSGLSGITAIAAGHVHACALTGADGVKCWGGLSYIVPVMFYGTTPVDVAGLTSGVTAIGAGDGFDCALTSSGGVKCWGSNFSDQLGSASSGSSTTPVDIPGLTSGVTAIAIGPDHACALTSAGGVKCWGANNAGQLGNGTNSPSVTGAPVDVAGLASGVVAIAAGTDHTCALMATGGVKCWGDNSFGQLGNSTVGNGFTTTPVDVGGL
jgi:alpha-tubulin suppressor-like RCC1 family protein